ncbi:MAG: serine--tRNA ligase, partial [Verrucomicrobia bacterium 21-51-4]
MIDVHFLRENPEQVRQALALKKFDCDLDAILHLDSQRRESLLKVEAKRADQNAANQQMASLDKKSPEFQAKLQAMKALSAEVKALEADEKQLEEQWTAALLTIPNLPDSSVPTGESEADNVVFKTWGNVEELVSAHATPHFDIPSFERWIDFPRGVKVTGAGFPFYVGGMARLVRALLQFFLSEAQANGYTELMCPHLINTASAMGTGALPDKEAQMYVATADSLYLIPTAEVPVTNFFRDEIIEAPALPIKLCAYTPCFRREAGSWGAHVRGLNRLHQFDKVELVKWTHPDSSFQELDALREDAQRILEKLNLPYRVLLMC